MKRSTFFFYAVSVLSILIGMVLSSAPLTTPIYFLTIRFGHGFIFAGASLIVAKMIGFYMKKKFSPTLNHLFSQESGEFFFSPWSIKKNKELLIISTSPKYSFSVILISILSCILLSYVLLPSIGDMISGTLELSLSNVLMIMVFAYILALIFIILSLKLIFNRIEKVIDKNNSLIKIYRIKKLKIQPGEIMGESVQIPASNLKNIEIEFYGYHQLLIPINDIKGNRDMIKNWIREEKLILIQSRDSNLIDELSSEILKFMKL